jgi:CBS-domain-containing membrane protein
VPKINIKIDKTNKQKTKQNKNKLHGLSLRVNYTDRSDRHFSAKLVPTFADRGCHMVSVMNPYGRILGFLDRSCTTVQTLKFPKVKM